LNQADRRGVYVGAGNPGTILRRVAALSRRQAGVTMKIVVIVVIGGTGLIGSKTVAILRQRA
jgi:hypothetical protein